MVSKLENSTADIFTEYDISIFSDGSIDPLGLLIIWTSLGNRIFHNRLNSISTNIRSYTLNLFHHAVIRQACLQNEEQFVNLIGKPPYNNATDLHEGLAIFLECLMAHVILQDNTTSTISEELMIPGVSKLNGLFANQSKHEICRSIPVNREDGILIRQHQLGVHGRHKGPFQQMNLFAKQNYYSDEKLWNQIDQLFGHGPLSKLKGTLVELIANHVLRAKIIGQKTIRIKVSTVVTSELAALYHVGLREEIITAAVFSDFWKEQLGLNDDHNPAGKIYQHIKTVNASDEESIFRALDMEDGDHIISAIIAIEPFIAMIQKIMERLLTRGQVADKNKLHEYIRHQFDNQEVDVNALYPYLRDKFLSVEAIRRLGLLMEMVASNRHPINPDAFIQQLVEFHHNIMKERGNVPWVSIGNSGTITQHRTFVYGDKTKHLQESYRWVNSYYIPTVIALHKGMKA